MCLGNKKTDGGKTGGYANNFGEPIGGGSTVDAIIITQILKPLLSRLVESRKELQGHENIVSQGVEWVGHQGQENIVSQVVRD